jgi:uncharacterized repeat protein (TIGR03803 family)
MFRFSADTKMNAHRSILLTLSAALGIALIASPARAETASLVTLHSFDGSDGANPNSPLLAVGSDFYGTTASGGLWGWGSIFRISRTGAFTSIYSFLGLGDGGSPQRLVLGPDGAIYGTTAAIQRTGQPDIWGTFFRIAPSGALATLVVFRGLVDGYRPGPVTLAHDGFFYGWTQTGGANGHGTAFRLSTKGDLIVIHDFTVAEYGAFGAFVEGSDGNLYVNLGNGVARMTLSGDVQTLGFSSVSPLVAGHDGRIYGTAIGGIPCDEPALVSFTPSGDLQYGRPVSGVTGCGSLAASLQSSDGSVFVTFQPQSGPGRSILRLTASGLLTFPRKFPSFASRSAVFLTDGGDGQLYGSASAEGGQGLGTIFRLSPGSAEAVLNDFGGRGRSDLSVFNSTTGVWSVSESVAFQFDLGDIPAPADYAGVGTATLAVFLPSASAWSGYEFPFFPLLQWGGNGDIPVPADYDGDSRADIAVYRPSTGQWFILNSRTNSTTSEMHQWGIPGDMPVQADYDGDGKADIAIYRPSTGTWYVLTSSSGFTSGFARTWGVAGDIPVVGDYDKDGKADFAVYRPSTGTWFVLKSGAGYSTWDTYQWGVSGDIPVPGDYDGDGRSDVTIYRPSTGTWFILKSSTGFTAWDTYTFGGPGDLPTAGRQ